MPGHQPTEVQVNNASVPHLDQPLPPTFDKQSGQTTPEVHDLTDLHSYSDLSLNASTSSLNSSLSSTIYNAVHLADDLTTLENDNSFDMDMAMDSDCQSCLDKDAEIRLLREKVDELRYLGMVSVIISQSGLQYYKLEYHAY